MYEYRIAETEDLEYLGNKNIEKHSSDPRWAVWKEEGICNHQSGRTKVFVVLYDGVPVGEGTLIFAPECSAIAGRTVLADGDSIVNVNALRIEKVHEGQGHISKLVRMMEAYAAEQGYQEITIGVEAKETRNLGIYLHWGYRTFVMSEFEDGDLILYYGKKLVQMSQNMKKV